MQSNEGPRISLRSVVIISVVFIGGILVLNNWIQSEFKEVKKSVYKPPRPAVVPTKPKAQGTTMEQPVIKGDPGEVVKKIRVVPGQEYIESVFFRGTEVIASQKESPKGVFDQSGTIPDGKVHYVDFYKKIKGDEYYRDGKREGQATAFYEDGSVFSKSYYVNGVLLVSKEYYRDGKLRFEVDYANSMDLADKREVGVGKLYFPNGVLKFEWNMTTTAASRFKKSYNQDGTLRHTQYFDENGQAMESSQPIESTQPVESSQPTALP